jgi:hypothetical protein
MATSTDLRAAIEEVQLAMPEGEAFDAEDFDPKLSLEKLTRRLGAMPWWVISSVVHTAIFLLATLLGMANQEMLRDNEEIIFHVDQHKEKEKIPPRRKRRDVFPVDVAVASERESEKVLITHQPVKEELVPQTANDVEFESMRGKSECISDIPTGTEKGLLSSMGVGPGAPGGGCFGYRLGGKTHAVTRFGGSQLTESAVKAALLWLKRHQESDGHWEAAKWEATLKGNRVNVAMTSFALLAFLGSGHTSRAGDYKDTVRRAENWLLAAQKRGGARYREKGRFERCMYTQGIAALALAEACGMEDSPPAMKAAAQDAVDVIVKAQGPYEGWNYTAKKAAGRNDTSVTGWNLMALKSARIAGLSVDGSAFQGCMRWLDAATNVKNGRCSYAGPVATVKPGRGSHAMWAAGMLMRQFMGVDRRDPILVAAGKSIGEHPPVWGPGDAGVDLYYWYYGTLCSFQQGGALWTRWNTHMKKALLENQREGGPLDGTAADVDGSWNPVGRGGIPRGGRVFSTALAALSLEVYYRYLPMYSK